MSQTSVLEKHMMTAPSWQIIAAILARQRQNILRKIAANLDNIFTFFLPVARQFTKEILYLQLFVILS